MNSVHREELVLGRQFAAQPLAGPVGVELGPVLKCLDGILGVLAVNTVRCPRLVAELDEGFLEFLGMKL